MIRTESREVQPATRPEVMAPFDYAALNSWQAATARQAAEFIDQRQRSMASSVLEIGSKLNEVKTALGHGHFTAWVASSFNMTIRTAQNYMTAATALEGKSETVSYLPVMTMLEVAKAPDEVRQRVVKQMDAAAKSAAPLPVEKVKDLLLEARAEAKAAAIEAKRTPAQKAKDKARRARETKEHEQHRESWAERTRARDVANAAVARLLVDKLGSDLPALLEAIEGSDFEGIKHWFKSQGDTGAVDRAEA